MRFVIDAIKAFSWADLIIVEQVFRFAGNRCEGIAQTNCNYLDKPRKLWGPYGAHSSRQRPHAVTSTSDKWRAARQLLITKKRSNK